MLSIFTYALSHLYIIIEWMSIEVLCLLFNQIYLLFVVSYRSSLYILDINTLSDTWSANFFSCSVGCLCCFACFLWCKEAFCFTKPICLFLPSLLVLLVSDPGNHCHIQHHEALPLFSSGSFIILGFTFWSWIHFELVFASGLREDPISFFCVYEHAVCPASFVEETVIFP